MSEWLTTAEVAERLNISESTVRKLIVTSVPVFRAGRCIRIREEDVDKYIADHMTRAVPKRRPRVPHRDLEQEGLLTNGRLTRR